MANGNKPLAADPYAHQTDGDWKIERLQDDRQLLSQVLGMTEGEIYEGSKKFIGSEQTFFQFLFAMRFLSRVNRFELRENATILRICSLIFAVEGVTPEKLKASERLSKFLATYLVRDHKLTLLRGFTFTPEYLLGADREADRHLMFEAAVGDNGFRKAHFHDRVPEFCCTGQLPTCFCLEWLAEQSEDVYNQFVSELGNKLYQMRCAVVHEGTPVVFARLKRTDRWSSGRCHLSMRIRVGKVGL